MLSVAVTESLSSRAGSPDDSGVGVDSPGLSDVDLDMLMTEAVSLTGGVTTHREGINREVREVEVRCLATSISDSVPEKSSREFLGFSVSIFTRSVTRITVSVLSLSLSRELCLLGGEGLVSDRDFLR